MTTHDLARTAQQRRAADALARIRELATQEYGHYVSYVSALPATIVMNGLGQALATLLARAKGNKTDPHRLLHDHLAGWLARSIEGLQPEGTASATATATGLIDRLMVRDQETYVAAQAEAMAYLTWLKQFARAYLEEPESHD